MPQQQFLSPDFKRNQIERALWQCMFKGNRPVSDTVSPVFLNRVKRLLEIDGSLVPSELTPVHAFVTGTADGNGRDRSFSIFDGFLLGVALEFLEAGFTQQDVIFLLQHIRMHLQQPFLRAMSYPSWDRNVRAPSDVPTAPVSTLGKIQVADTRVFILLNKLDLKEIHGFEVGRKGPIISAPVIIFGHTVLCKFLDEDTYIVKHRLLMEIGRLATDMRDALRTIPAIKRGRKSKAAKKEVSDA